jgi:hypothetical protein
MLEGRTLLSVYTVDHLADDLVGNGLNGSLRYCITNAADGDSIHFGVTGTIKLTRELPDLNHSIRIDGPGADQLTVGRYSGAYYRIFTVDQSATVSFDGLTIADGIVLGDDGGGIYNGGTLTVSNCTISQNTAIDNYDICDGWYGGDGGGIYNGGTLTVHDCTFSGNYAYTEGGGICNFAGAFAAKLTVSDSTLSGNGALATYGGGGICNDTFSVYNKGTVTVTGSTLSGNGDSAICNNLGTLTVSDSTLSGNTGGLYGGGIINLNGTLTVTGSTLSGNSAQFYGGGICNFSSGVFAATLTVSDSTLSGNSAVASSGAGGGICTLGTGTVTLTNVTLTANRATAHGGGLYVDTSSALLHNTLIAGNFRSATGTTRDDVFGTLDPGGDYNLIGDGSGMTGLTNGVNGNLVGSASDPLDPLLDSLQDNGGPTQTRALLAGSPALNAGDPSQLGVPDQRGVVRSGGVNIGAYQASASAFVLTAPATVTAGVPFDVTVKAVDPFGQTAIGYTGTVHFSSTDGQAVLPGDYTFTAGDNGAHTFSGGATLETTGDQSITVSDTVVDPLTGSLLITVR